MSLRLIPFLMPWALLIAADCSKTSTGYSPLNDPFYTARFARAPGGLYPNGANVRPAAHEAAGRRAAADGRPRNAAGEIDERGGRIVFLSIGMSNATQEFLAFKQIADRDPGKNPAVLNRRSRAGRVDC
jgi:hypothetical protein